MATIKKLEQPLLTSDLTVSIINKINEIIDALPESKSECETNFTEEKLRIQLDGARRDSKDLNNQLATLKEQVKIAREGLDRVSDWHCCIGCDKATKEVREFAKDTLTKIDEVGKETK